ncbi:hypothetical protein [Salinicola tamaricis]|uniref:hypothetical protein n=1 Tax=Salinicola tamaricis TaxID=1771309 RepID=UPI001A931CD5|nr:hypothetical protein [Salinicola tamaricis]
MTPVTPPGAGTPMPLPTPDTQMRESQNLFEHMANLAGQPAQGPSPGQLGSDLLDNLDGFIERVNAFSRDAQVPAAAPERLASTLPGDAPASVTQATAPGDAGDTPSALDDDSVTRVADTLARVFDHSIETTMVVRGATQVSGSANTLLRGQ